MIVQPDSTVTVFVADELSPDHTATRKAGAVVVTEPEVTDAALERCAEAHEARLERRGEHERCAAGPDRPERLGFGVGGAVAGGAEAVVALGQDLAACVGHHGADGHLPGVAAPAGGLSG